MTMLLGLAACVFRSVEVLPLARSCGFDFLLADMEHGPMSLGEAAALCTAGHAAGYPVHVRAPGPGSDLLSRIVDCGAAGLVVPHVDTVAQARAVVDRVRFAPRGARSVPSPLVRDGFRPRPAAETIAEADAGVTVLAMIESAEGLAAAPAIAAVPGIDGLVVGVNDLTQSLGVVGQPEHPDIHAACGRVASAAADAGGIWGAMGLPERLIEGHARAFGAGWLVATNEINLLFEAGRACVDRLRPYRADRERTNDP